jgi:hypothetical protein
VLLRGLLGSLICAVLFGLSKSFAWAIITRSMWGFLNGEFEIFMRRVIEFIS